MSILDSASRWIDSRDRMTKRRDIRKQIATAQLRERKAAERNRAIQAIERQLDEAAEAHAASVGPIQTELADLETEITGLLADRSDVPPKLYTRRQELLDKLHDHNTSLETECRLLNDRRKALQAESNRESLRNQGQLDTQGLTNKLAGQELACPDLYANHFAATQGIKWSKLRHDAARAQVAKWSQLSAKVEAGKLRTSDPTTYPRRLHRWQEELRTAEASYTSAVQEASEARARIIDE